MTSQWSCDLPHICEASAEWSADSAIFHKQRKSRTSFFFSILSRSRLYWASNQFDFSTFEFPNISTIISRHTCVIDKPLWICCGNLKSLTYWNSRWISQEPVLMAHCFNYLNILPVTNRTNCIIRIYQYKSCFIYLGDYSCCSIMMLKVRIEAEVKIPMASVIKPQNPSLPRTWRGARVSCDQWPSGVIVPNHQLKPYMFGPRLWFTNTMFQNVEHILNKHNIQWLLLHCSRYICGEYVLPMSVLLPQFTEKTAVAE